MQDAVGIIADIVGSRTLTDRAEAQYAILRAFDQAQYDVPALHPVWATVGDEFQAVTTTWQQALRLTLRVHALLPKGLRLRFGIGAGQITTIQQGAAGPIQDGTAWLNARQAIEQIEGDQQHRDELLTGFHSATPQLNTLVASHLVLRDHIVGRMKLRERRVFAAVLTGATQQEAARAEKISQAAVSQILHRSGAMALLDADTAFADAETSDPA